MTSDPLPPRWSTFLQDVDAALGRPVELHCLGGFVLLARFGSPRPTFDVDFIVGIPNDAPIQLIELAGKNTALAKRHGLYLDKVNLGVYPDDYEDRLIDLVTPELHHLKLRALEPHDLILAKIDRNSGKDAHDVHFLAEKGVLNASVLEARYREHLRPYLLTSERADLTLSLWLDAIREIEKRPAVPERDPGGRER